MEKHLDASQPVERRAETWGAQVAADQFAQMKAAAEAATERRRQKKKAKEDATRSGD